MVIAYLMAMPDVTCASIFGGIFEIRPELQGLIENWRFAAVE